MNAAGILDSAVHRLTHGSCRSKVRWQGLLACLIAIALGTPAQLSLADLRSPGARDYDVFQFLSSYAFVAKGRLLGIREDERPFAGGCGDTHTTPSRIYTFSVHIDHVLDGLARDTVIQICSFGPLGPGVGIGDGMHGRGVIAYGNRVCEDADQLWGGVIPMGVSGSLQLAPWQSSKPPGKAIYAQDIDGLFSLVSTHDHLHARMRHAIGVALMRVSEYTITGYAHRRLTCDSLGWVFGQGPRVPRAIDLIYEPPCGKMPSRGDTILVPLSAQDLDQPPTFTMCWESLIVRNGYVPALDGNLNTSELKEAWTRIREGR